MLERYRIAEQMASAVTATSTAPRRQEPTAPAARPAREDRRTAARPWSNKTRDAADGTGSAESAGASKTRQAATRPGRTDGSVAPDIKGDSEWREF